MPESFEKPTGDAVRSEGDDSAQAAPLYFSLRTLLLVVLIVGIVLGGFWNWIVPAARRREQAQECVNNLKQIGLAIQMYHDTFQKLPEATVCDAAGRPLHSWRIFVVPYMFSSPLFSMYRQSEPWNGPNNQKLAFGKPVRWTAKGGASEFSPLTPIYSFRCPCLHEEDSSKCITNYLAVTGAGTAFPDDQRVRMKDITDGTQNTIIVVETVADDINCLEPRDLRIDKMSFKINDNSKPSISSRHPDGPHVLFADCGVYRLNPEIPPVTLKALLTIGGGEAIDRDRLIAEGWLR